MSISEEQKKLLFPKSLEVKIADTIFILFRKNMLLIKALNIEKVHFSMFIIGPIFDFHLTLENERDPKKKHIKLLQLQLDIEFLLEQIIREVVKHGHTIFRVTKIDDPELQDLEIDIHQTQLLMKLFEKMNNKKRVNIDYEFLNKLDSSQPVKISDITENGWIGWTSDEQIIFSDGKKVGLLNFALITDIADKLIEHSIRKITLKYYTPKLLIWWTKIKLLNINRTVVNFLRKISS